MSVPVPFGGAVGVSTTLWVLAILKAYVVEEEKDGRYLALPACERYRL